VDDRTGIKQAKKVIPLRLLIGTAIKDIGLIVAVTLLMIGSWILPRSKWPWWARKVATGQLATQSKMSDQEMATVRTVVGDRPADWIEKMFRPNWVSQKYLAWMHLLACIWPRKWEPSPRLVGRDHIDAALAKGQGVLLLASNFAFKDLMGKAALAKAGYRPCQLSQDTHGFAQGPLCRRILNPIYHKIEARYLDERLVFSGLNTKKVKSLMKDRLKRNRLLIVATTPAGRKAVKLPFLRGKIQIATGAMNLAYEQGAPMLPAFTIRQPNGQIDMVVEAPLEKPIGRSREETIESMLADYVAKLEVHAGCHPEQFLFPLSGRSGQMMIQPSHDDEVT